MPLTTGPTSTHIPISSIDGKKIFVVAAQVRGELVHYNPSSGELTPYLSGISATAVNFSRDGKWMTYVAYPEGSLWRSKVDGSERLQLTFPTLFAYLPRWSPDGTRIAFMAGSPDRPDTLYLVSADGGSPRQPIPGSPCGSDPNWSPDGNSLLFGCWPRDKKLDLRTLDLRTGVVSKVPGSDELWSPRWSRGRSLRCRCSPSST